MVFGYAQIVHYIGKLFLVRAANASSLRKEIDYCNAMLCVFEDDEAVTKMIIKGRRPTMRHVPRIHRVAV